MSIAGALRSNQAEEFRRPCPAGEDNWKSRATFANVLADAIETDPSAAPAGFAATLEPFYNNLLDCAISERTTLSNACCRLLGALPKILGKDIHPHLDRFLPVLIKQCASTKTVAQKSASAAISNIIMFSPFSHRTLWHVCQAFEDKYSAPKLYAPSWLKLIIENYYPALNPDRDYEIISRAISIGLEEADNNVRVNSRAVFWAYQKIDHTGAENIMDKLNNHAKTALINDPNNPDKSKAKSKKSAESTQGLAQIRQQAKERLKAKVAERNRIVSTKTINSEDLAFGPPNLGDDKQATVPPNQPTVLPSTSSKTTSRQITVHKKGSSHDDQIPSITKKASAIDISSAASKKTTTTESLLNSQLKKSKSTDTTDSSSARSLLSAASKKTATTESLLTSQLKKSKSTDVTDSSSARPLLSAPVRRPRIVAKPINVPQTSSRPNSRAGFTHSVVSKPDPVTKFPVDYEELELATPQTRTLAETLNLPSRSSKQQRSHLSSPVAVPSGKENALIYKPRKIVDPDAVDRPVLKDHNPGPQGPGKIIQMPSDGTTKEQRINRQEMDLEIGAMAPLVPLIAAHWEVQDTEKCTQMHHVYPEMNHDGEVVQARRALVQALDHISKDALDLMGFRKLRKMVETFGRQLIIDRNHYNQLMSELLPRIGTFEELLTQPIHEVQNERHPRYIRQAVLSIINVLIHEYPYDWSSPYQGPALASMIIARCAYSANYEFHEGAPYVTNLTTVNLIGDSMNTILDNCRDPLPMVDTIVQMIETSERFLLLNGPRDSEEQDSWATFNPYSKIHRLRTQKASGLDHLYPENLTTFKSLDVDPEPLPMKLPLLIETGIKLMKLLIEKAETEEFRLGSQREERLAIFSRHLLASYSVIIRRQVMDFIKVLFRNFESDERFWMYFSGESERNLIHFYLMKDIHEAQETLQALQA